jgi:hypothetical protein
VRQGNFDGRDRHVPRCERNPSIPGYRSLGVQTSPLFQDAERLRPGGGNRRGVHPQHRHPQGSADPFWAVLATSLVLAVVLILFLIRGRNNPPRRLRRRGRHGGPYNAAAVPQPRWHATRARGRSSSPARKERGPNWTESEGSDARSTSPRFVGSHSEYYATRRSPEVYISPT